MVGSNGANIEMSDWGNLEVDEPKSSSEKALERLIKANKAVKELWLSIHEIKLALAGSDFVYAAQLWRELTDEERECLNIAPTKGGIFTIEENKLMASDEFREAVKKYFEDKK